VRHTTHARQPAHSRPTPPPPPRGLRCSPLLLDCENFLTAGADKHFLDSSSTSFVRRHLGKLCTLMFAIWVLFPGSVELGIFMVVCALLPEAMGVCATNREEKRCGTNALFSTGERESEKEREREMFILQLFL
jgi:hypothetical protein